MTPQDLKQTIIKSDLTIKQVAQMIDLNYDTLYHSFRKNYLHYKTAARLADLFDISISEIDKVIPANGKDKIASFHHILLCGMATLKNNFKEFEQEYLMSEKFTLQRRYSKKFDFNEFSDNAKSFMFTLIDVMEQRTRLQLEAAKTENFETSIINQYRDTLYFLYCFEIELKAQL